ncbi:MAG: hypothetical protein ACOCV1_00090 [Bacillota bacterium]
MKSQGQKQREWVNKEFKKLTKGKSLSLEQKSMILTKLWKKARRKY